MPLPLLGWKTDGKSTALAELMASVEITGPTDRKMVINALNSGAKTFMADFEGGLIRNVPADGRLQLANMVQHGSRPGQFAGCDPSRDRL